jgi:beta-lactamase class A
MRCCRNALAVFFITLAFTSACSTSKKNKTMAENTVTVTPAIPVDNTKTDAFLENLLKENPSYFTDVLANSKQWNTQIIYTQINRGVNGMPGLKNYYYNVNPANYFYPASTVKFPVSLLALQKLNEIKAKARLNGEVGQGIDKNTTMITEVGTSLQTAVYNDPTAVDGRPTIAQYIKKILMVSDNDAFNRLYEFLGQDYINSELQKKGYKDAQILHRLQITLPEEENRKTNPVKFLSGGNTILYEQAMQTNTRQYVKRNDSVGKGFYQSGELVTSPMDFSNKNRMGLEDLHTILVSLVFPEKIKAAQRFNLTEDDRRFVLKYMSQLPTESTYPPYWADTANYWPAYCKFLLFGSKKGNLPNNIRLFNKVGDAYGHLLDVAYVVDYEKGVEFFLSAIIYCNSDGILNDDKYDYDSIGFPFMKNLGKAIYEYEIKREKKYLPDLSAFKFEYDK